MPKRSGGPRAPDGDYEVGYGRPPKHSRWRKGQSGNAKGRPKGSLSLGAVMDRELRRTVRVQENGKAAQVTMLELLVRTTLAAAAKGDNKARSLALALIERHTPSEAAETSAEGSLSPEDQQVLEAFLAEARTLAGGDDDQLD